MPCRLALVFVSLLTLAPAGTSVQRDKPRWLDDVAAAQAESRLTGKPIFAVLH